MKLRKLNRTLVGAMVITGAMGIASQAHAATDLSIDPTYMPRIEVSTSPPSALDVADVESLILSTWNKTVDLGLAYKQEYDSMPPDTGTAEWYYKTTFSGEPNNATITWETNSPFYIACGDCYLVVKDGNASPYAYIFDLSNPGGWDGQGTLNLSNFWPGPQGAISYVAIYNNASMDGGGTIAAIPEPETYAMLLAGLGLVGFAVRRKIARTA